MVHFDKAFFWLNEAYTNPDGFQAQTGLVASCKDVQLVNGSLVLKPTTTS